MKENWKPIVGAETLYEVSDLGRVRSLDREVKARWGGPSKRIGKVLKAINDTNGYMKVCLCVGGVKIYASVHRLVAKHFLPPSVLPEINHLDFNRSNNVVENLEWTTHKNNQGHSANAGRFSALTNPRKARKLSAKSVVAIRTARAKGTTLAAIGVKFGVSESMVSSIIRGVSWKQPSNE